MKKRNIVSSPAQNLGWGSLTQVKLPGGGKLGIYQPRHARPKSVSAGKTSVKAVGRATKKTAGGTTKRA